MVVLHEVIQRPKVRGAVSSSTSVLQSHSRKGGGKKHGGSNMQLGPEINHLTIPSYRECWKIQSLGDQ